MSDRVKRSLVAFVEGLLGPRIDRCALYPGRIVSVSGAELDVQLDDERWPTMTRVPLRAPFPGAAVDPVTGSRVLVGWEEADATKPYALPVWGPSDPATSIKIDATSTIVFGGSAADFIALAGKSDGEFAKIEATLNSLVGGSGAPAEFTVPYSRSGVGGSKVKAE